MYQNITVVPSDRLIIVDGEALRFDFSANPSLHAIQWHNGSGHMEIKGKDNIRLVESDYAEKIAPYVALWEAEKARLSAEAEAADAAHLAEYNSESVRFERLRAARNEKISATDYLLTPDYPIDDAIKAEVIAYRKALRDLPAQAGTPWDGGGNETPWPQKPAVVKG